MSGRRLAAKVLEKARAFDPMEELDRPEVMDEITRVVKASTKRFKMSAQEADDLRSFLSEEAVKVAGSHDPARSSLKGRLGSLLPLRVTDFFRNVSSQRRHTRTAVARGLPKPEPPLRLDEPVREGSRLNVAQTVAAPDTDPARAVLNREFAETARGHLTPSQRKIFDRMLQGDNVVEAAAALGLRKNTAQQHAFNMIKRLRERLNPKDFAALGIGVGGLAAVGGEAAAAPAGPAAQPGLAGRSEASLRCRARLQPVQARRRRVEHPSARPLRGHARRHRRSKRDPELHCSRLRSR